MKDSFGSGELIRWILVIGFLLFAYKSIRERGNWLFAVVVFAVTYAFFTIAATKLTGYVSIVSSFGFIFLLYPFQLLFQYLKSKKEVKVGGVIKTALILIVLFLQFSPKGVVGRHKYEAPDYREARIGEIEYARRLLDSEPDFKGYFLLKDDKTNVLAVLLFHTDKKVLYYNPFLEKKLVNNCRILDLSNR